MEESTDTSQESSKIIDSLHEALKQVLYQNQMMLRWVDGAVLSVDREGNVLEANEAALQSLGWKANELIGRQCHESIHHTLDDDGEYPWDFCPVFAAIEDGSAHHVDGDLFWKRDGTSFLADYIVCPIRDENNQISGATLTFRNLTEMRMQEAKQIHGTKLESIGELAAGIAHEINTPIQFISNNMQFLNEFIEELNTLYSQYQSLTTAIRGHKAYSEFEDMLSELKEMEENADIEYLMEEAPKAIEQTVNGVERVAKLVLGLKGFAHSSDSQTKVDANINEIIENTLIVCQNAYKYVAECKTNFVELPTIKVLQGDIGQVILNLVVNAAHAIEDSGNSAQHQGLIEITTRANDTHVEIEVADNGGGVDEGVRDRIFDPFFTTKAVGKGSGQGLAISRTIIVEKHGGNMFFESIAGEGTTFTISLPIS